MESLEDPYLSNDYTEAAKAIRAILSNEEIIYARSTSYSKQNKTVIGRNKTDGNVESINDNSIYGNNNLVYDSGSSLIFGSNNKLYYGE